MGWSGFLQVGQNVGGGDLPQKGIKHRWIIVANGLIQTIPEIKRETIAEIKRETIAGCTNLKKIRLECRYDTKKIQILKTCSHDQDWYSFHGLVSKT